MHNAMATTQPQHGSQRDEWEEWTDDEPSTPKGENSPAQSAAPGSSPLRTHSTTASRSTKPRQSTSRIQRLKSRKRQKDQNAKAGIRLVTDMTRFRKGPHHVAQLVKPAAGPHSSHPATGKFSDASALRALEGSPNAGSVGNWAWLKNSPSATSVSTFTGDTTPDSSKIVIGISLPEDDAASKDISPQTAVVATPFDRLPLNKPSTNPFHNQQAKSAWSPDTEDSFSPARHLGSMSGIYSQATSVTPGQPGVPPVPALPSSLKNPAKARLSRNDFDDDDDDSTPITLFEEDGHKTPASATSKISPAVTTATSARSGWWDHLTTPFRERFSPVVKSDKETTSPAGDEWWKGQDEKKTIAAAHLENHPAYSASSSSATLRPHPSPVPIIRVPTPTIASSSSSGASTHAAPSHEGESRSEKARVMMEEDAEDAPAELPPPYERTPSTKQPKPVRFRAVFPPGHELANAYPPSPQPGSPGLDGTMSSQGGIKLTNVPLTPVIGTDTPLPERKAGTYVTGDHFLANYGSDPAAKIERTRRRHEKEDYVAHKAGGFWRGRGCIPESGCYGRSGREGRQRRRIWIGAICLAFLLLTTLGVVLGVVLSKRMARPAAAGNTATTGGSTGGSEIDNVWLNLTDFPPIPTGLSTIVAPDNSQIVNGCAAPSTLWSCSLPPEQQAANEPHDADQPGFIFQIQYDNNTRQLWNMPNGTPPTPTEPEASTSSKASASSSASATSASASASATNSIQGGDLSSPSTKEKRATTLYDAGIAPNPDPPSFQEMWFLGNTTDGIVSDDKAGEPTPFYISFFTNTSGSAGPNMLKSDETVDKRGIGNGIGSGTDSTGSLSELLPPPALNADGTGAPAQLRPFPFQQPLRLFDRGLPTEHYGFYSYFNKTIYVTSMDGNETSGPVAADASGGAREGTAKFLVSWTQTRFVVKIWTRKGGASRLMGGSGGPAADVDDLAAMPGTFPYPVTVGEDTHGGSVDLKATFAYGVEPDRHVNTTDATLFTNDVGFGGAAVNPRLPNGDLSWGGVDGGTGGCRCEWVNWVEA